MLFVIFVIAKLFRGTSKITVKLSQKKHYIAENCYSEQKVLALGEKFKPNLLLYSTHLIFLWGNKNKLLFDFQKLLFDALLYLYIY